MSHTDGESGITSTDGAVRGRRRSLPGLLEKYDVHYMESDEYRAMYLRESFAALQKWRDTELAGTLTETYEVTEGPASEIAVVMLVLHGQKDPL